MGYKTTVNGEDFFVNSDITSDKESLSCNLYVSKMDDYFSQDELALTFQIGQASSQLYTTSLMLACNAKQVIDVTTTAAACFSAASVIICFVPQFNVANPGFCTMEFNNLSTNSAACINGISGALGTLIGSNDFFSQNVTLGMEFNASTLADSVSAALSLGCTEYNKPHSPVKAPPFPVMPLPTPATHGEQGGNDSGGNSGAATGTGIGHSPWQGTGISIPVNEDPGGEVFIDPYYSSGSIPPWMQHLHAKMN